MPFVESIRQAKQGGQRPDVTPRVGVQVLEVRVVLLGKRSAMIASDQADDHAFLGSERQLGRTNDDLLRHFVMVFRVLGLAHVVEHRGGTQPDPLGIAHAVQRLKLVKKAYGQSRNLKRVIRFETVRFADLDDGVDDPSASHVASFSFQFSVTGWYASLFMSEERARGLYSCRLSFGFPNAIGRVGEPHLLPPTSLLAE
jgi:hypothetical protein